MVLGRECLRALRAHVSGGGGALDLIEGSVFKIGEGRFAATEPTGYRSSRDKHEYSLAALVLLVDLRNKRQSEKDPACFFSFEEESERYVSACVARGAQPVVVIQKAEVLAYLDGKADSSKHLVEVADAENDAASSGGPAAGAATGPAESLITEKPSAAIGAASDETSDAADDGDYVNTRATPITAHGKDFTFAVEVYDRFKQRRALERKRQASDPKKRADGIGRLEVLAATSEMRRKLDKAVDRGPPRIIVVPNAMTSIFTMLNARDFLAEGNFATVAEKKAAGAKKEASLTFERTRADGAKLTYRIVDNPSRLKPEEWVRVTAVFAQGPAWQFKGWPTAKPVELFSKTCGFHLHFDDENPQENIKNWNVHVLKISKTKRHLDEPVQLAFWRYFDEFVEKHQRR